MHKNSMLGMWYFFNKYMIDYIGKEINIADIGSADVDPNPDVGNYREIFNQDGWRYVGYDISNDNNVDIVLKELYEWNEIKSNSFDVVISGQAIEHMEFPWLAFKEMSRILKTGGKLCVIAPAMAHLHRYPIDCYRFFPDGMKALCKISGIKVDEAMINEWDGFSQDCMVIGTKI